MLEVLGTALIILSHSKYGRKMQPCLGTEILGSTTEWGLGATRPLLVVPSGFQE